MKFVNKNYYEILDLEPAASEEEVNRAYRLVRGTWNPDSIAVYSLYTPEENDAIGHKIEEAYQVLSNKDRRISYNQYLNDVDKLTPRMNTPLEFWDFVHGVAPPREDDKLEDVSHLLVESEREATEDRLALQTVMEAAGGNARGLERDMNDASPVSPHQDAIPAPDYRSTPPQGRTPAPERQVGAAANGASRPRTSRPGSAVSSRGARPRVPAAPAAPGSDTWNIPSGARSKEAPRAAGQGRTVQSRPIPAQRSRVSGARPGEQGRPAANQPSSQPPAIRGTLGWSRSYVRPLRRPAPLKFRTVPPEVIAETEAELGLSGAFLAAIRDLKGVTLEEISDRTKVQVSYLRNLEEERFEDFPAAVYVEGFVSQYARLLKLDVDRVTAGYMTRYQRQSEDDQL